MRAARLTGSRSIEARDLPAPEPGDGEVVVEVAACGICGSDLSLYKGHPPREATLGHEVSGTVVGGDGAFALGARVVLDPKISCGDCDDCASGRAHLCLAALTQSIGLGRDGAMAERVTAPTSCLIGVPDELDLTAAALAEPLSVALHGLNRAGATGEDCAVIGCGPIGLLSIAAMRARGAQTIIAVDPVPERRALAEALGATAIEPESGLIMELRPDLVIETSGNPRAIAKADFGARAGARVLLLGVCMSPAEVYPLGWVTREITLIGSIGQTRADMIDALDLLVRSPDIADIITDRIGIDDVPDAFERLTTNPTAGKVMVTP